MALELWVSMWMASALRLRVHSAGAVPTWGQAAVMGTLMWVGYFLVLWALSLAPLAVVAPVRETAVVAVAVWGVWRLGERSRAPVKLSGAVATLAGVALLAV
jgi:drug/metabolite transporter (DMT)-like permease